jgi:tetratricopeptide (TPR) repeat protein
MTREPATDPAALMRSSVEASEAGDLDAAIEYARQAARVAPDLADSHNAIGIALAKMGERDEARVCFERAIALAPSHPEGYLNLGRLCLERFEAPDEAARIYRQAISLFPQVMGGYLGLCACLVRQDSLDQVLATVRRSGLLPDPYAAHLPIADALTREGRYYEARACCQRLLDARPGDAKAHALLGEIAYVLRDTGEALQCFERAAQLAPADPAIVSGLLRALAFVGRFDEARRVYLAAGDALSAMQTYRFPVWRGEPLEGKTLFMRTTRGHGDAIQFTRYAALAKARGARLVVQAPAPLAPLLRTVDGIDAVILTQEDAGLADYECDFELFGLLAGIAPEDAGRHVPYVSVPDISADTGREIAAGGAALRVALAWESRQLFERDPYRNRSIPLAQLRPIYERKDVEFFVVQKGSGARQLRNDESQARLVEVGSRCRHYGDTAAYLSRMDLVICGDGSIAHLAGALGRPTCLLLPFAADWRWGDRADVTPWYPAARLVRQEQPGDWTKPVRAASLAIDALFTRLAGHRIQSIKEA